jgi:hypothetical protein
MSENPPAKLYKYQCVSKQSLENLINGCIYFSKPENFNDPFDCKETIRFREPKKSELIKYGNMSKTARFYIEQNRQSWQAERERVLQQMGVACFSATTADNILMWSHYADRHMGFCLEFDRGIDPFNRAERVIYSRYYGIVPALLLLQKRNDPEFQEKAQVVWSDKITKSTCWKYEREWRIFDKPGKSCPYDKVALTGVYFGYRMSEEDKKTICKILENTKTSFCCMVRSNTKFKLIPKPYVSNP